MQLSSKDADVAYFNEFAVSPFSVYIVSLPLKSHDWFRNLVYGLFSYRYLRESHVENVKKKKIIYFQITRKMCPLP